MTKNYPQLDLDQSFINEIIELVLYSESQGIVFESMLLYPFSHFTLERAPSLIANSANARDKLVGQIGITYGVLRRLGFSEDIVKTCLTEAPGVDLEQAFDWVRPFVRFDITLAHPHLFFFNVVIFALSSRGPGI